MHIMIGRILTGGWGFADGLVGGNGVYRLFPFDVEYVHIEVGAGSICCWGVVGMADEACVVRLARNRERTQTENRSNEQPQNQHRTIILTMS